MNDARWTPEPGDALVIVDLQRDFLPGGALAVPRGDEVIPHLNAWVETFRRAKLPVVATRDWHPPDHCSFTDQGGPWPVHCVAGTEGAAFAEQLDLPEDVVVVSKATRPEEEAYSGFAGTDLRDRLQALGVGRLFVGGLATDYCVMSTVLDAREAGFDVVVIGPAVRAVDVKPGDGRRALEAMAAAGARIIDPPAGDG